MQLRGDTESPGNEFDYEGDQGRAEAMKQETALTMLWGALAAAGAYGLFLAGKKAMETSRDLVSGLQGIGKIAEANQKLVETSSAVAIELQLLRSTIMGANPAPAVEEDQGTVAEPARPKPTQYPFPAPNMDFYANAPDAAVEDTTIDETDDAQMKQNEDIEAVRQQGYEADPAELEGA